jgi:hypothetical protein
MIERSTMKKKDSEKTGRALFARVKLLQFALRRDLSSNVCFRDLDYILFLFYIVQSN